MSLALPFTVLVVLSVSAAAALAGQVPGDASTPDVPISHADRVYAAEQFSNTVSVTTRSTTSCSASSDSAIHNRATSRPSTKAKFWSTAWASHRTTRHLRSCRSDPIR